MAHGFDLSFSRLSADWVRRRRAEGYEVGVQDAFTGGEISSRPLEAVAGPNLGDMVAGDLPVAITYTNVAPWHTDGRRCIAQAERIAGPLWPGNRNVLVIDVELIYYQPDGTWLEERIVHEAIAEARGRGYEPIVYTAKWAINWWALRLGHVPQFDAAGWYANFNGVAVIDPEEAPKCFKRGVMGKQRWGSTEVEGVTIDLDVFDMEFFGRAASPAPPLSDAEEAFMGAVKDAFTRAGEIAEAEIAKAQAGAQGPPGPAGPQGPPGPAGGTAPTTTAITTYTVVSGDTASGIAARFGLTLRQLQDMNGGPNERNWNLIYPGDRLRVG